MNRLASLLGISTLLVAASPLFGAVVLDFGTGGGGVGGTYNFASPNASGSGIPIGDLTVTNDPGHNGVYTVNGPVACMLGGGCGSLSFNTAPGSNFIQIFGDIPSLGITTNEVLLSGTISSFTASNNGINASGPDTKAANLLAALGIPAGSTFNFFGFSITTNGLNSDSVISTDIRNTGTATPEAASVAMLSTMILGCGLLLRRKLANRA